jgi:hypothetical protein
VRQRLFAVAVLGSVVVIALVVAWVFFFGRLDPSPPSLRDHPEPSIPGEILFVNTDGCIIAARASGEEYRELICRSDIQGATWLPDGRVLFAGTPVGRENDWWVLDPGTGQQSRVESTVGWWEVFMQPDYESPGGEKFTAGYNNEGDVTIIGADGRERVIYEYDGPDGYYPDFRTWSPDARFLVVHYARDEELWIIAADGSVAGTLARNVAWSPVSWRIEGVGILPEMDRPVGGLDTR